MKTRSCETWCRPECFDCVGDDPGRFRLERFAACVDAIYIACQHAVRCRATVRASSRSVYDAIIEIFVEDWKIKISHGLEKVFFLINAFLFLSTIGKRDFGRGLESNNQSWIG